jgi:hypothetical protein
MTIAPETERSKTRVARKVYRYRDAELARLMDPPPPSPPLKLELEGRDDGGSRTVTVGGVVVKDDMKGKQGAALMKEGNQER